MEAIERKFKYPNYLLTKYQNEIYRQLITYMRVNKFTQKDIAQKLNVSNAYVSQILNGNFNFTLKKLIELGLMMGKAPFIEFVDYDEFLNRQEGQVIVRPQITFNITINVVVLPMQKADYVEFKGFETESIVSSSALDKPVSIDELEFCSN
ncbi:MAG: helix-turn-helix transcriptional regulator [Bacteroidetes bacterium]|nr:helix-turn-helix transcriptional regulator [Bacteroidota bacterium]